MADINLIVNNFEDIKRSIIEKFKNDPNSPFKDYDFEGSGLNYLIDILTYVTNYNNFYATTTVNELYLPYAKIPKNIYALSRSLGYLPKRPTSSSAQITAELPDLYNADLTQDIVIPLYSNMKSQKGLNYVLMEEIRFRYDVGFNQWKRVLNDIFEPDTTPYMYTIKQGQFQNMYYSPNQQPSQRFIINKKNAIIRNYFNTIFSTEVIII